MTYREHRNERIVEPDEPLTLSNPRQLIVDSARLTPEQLLLIEYAGRDQEIIDWQGQPCAVLIKRQVTIDRAEYLLENVNNNT